MRLVDRIFSCCPRGPSRHLSSVLVSMVARARSVSGRWRGRPSAIRRPLLEELEDSDRPAVAKIVKLYDEILNRPVDSDGLRFYLAELKKGRRLATVARALLSSEEYTARRGSARPTEQARRLASEIADRIEATGENEAPPLLRSLLGGIKAYVDQPVIYRWWLCDFERPLLQNRSALEARVRALRVNPTFAFIISLRDATYRDILKTIATIRTQAYPNIELLLLTPQPWVRWAVMFVNSLVLQDRRIRFSPDAKANSIGGPLHLAIQKSQGDFVALVRAGDQLSVAATLEFAEALGRNPALAVMYADSDYVDIRGKRHSPEFRSTWDPDRLLAGQDLGPLVLYSTGSLQGLDNSEPQTVSAAQFELCARIGLGAAGEEIGHIPRVLCHRGDSRQNAQKRAAERAEILRRLAAARGAQLIYALGERDPYRFRVAYPVPQPAPLVSVLIPTRERVDLLRRCLETVLEKTDYPSLQIILIDNGSCEDETLQYYSEIRLDPRILIVPYSDTFNWGAMNNAGARAACGQILVLLNNDTEVIESNWLNELVGQALRPEIGVVGARLLYPDQTLQHGGVVTTPRGAGQHVMRHSSPEDPGYMDMLSVVHEVSAVTGACLAVRKEVFEQVVGIEEHHLRVACSDVDLCFRVRSKGYRVIWTPNATLVHKELATRGPDNTPEKVERSRKEESYMAEKWAVYLKEDPFWSPNLEAEEDAPPLLAIPPRATVIPGFLAQEHSIP
jgi:O-antigen biosynthesis protein